MVDELQRALGNRTDISEARLVRWLNWAMLDLCGFHRKRVFPAKRFHQLEGQTTFSLTVESGTAQDGGSTSITLSATASSEDDYYNDQVISCNGEEKVITDYSGGTHVATVHSAWSTDPESGDDYTIHRRKYPITGATGLTEDQVWTIMRLEEIDTGGELTHRDWRDVAGGQPTQLQEPGSFARYGDHIIFNTAPEEQVSFRCYYYRLPTLLATGSLTEECDLSEQWHETIVLGAIWRGHERLMEPERAQQARQLYVDEAANRLDDYMIEDIFIERGIKVRKT